MAPPADEDGTNDEADERPVEAAMGTSHRGKRSHRGGRPRLESGVRRRRRRRR